MGRRLGQHFLTDTAILDRIVDAIDPAPDDVVLEIGPGQGSLTRRLAPRVGKVVAIEKDERLARGKGEDPWPANVNVIGGDALEVDWHALVAPRSSLVAAAEIKVVGNIPYYITSPLIDKALTPPLPAVIVFLMQREVADRLAAAPGSKVYGALTVGVQAVASVERMFVVKAGAFKPPPKVDSAVVRLRPLAQPLVKEEERPAFRTFVTGLFSQRRKQLVRSLRDVAGVDRDGAVRLLEGLDVPLTLRADALDVAALVRLFRAARDSNTAR